MSDKPHILFAVRPEWADIVPVEQYESNFSPLAPIFYSEQYKDATDYFRGVVKKGEKSVRVLELTEAVIRLNPAHYTAWQYRYDTLLSLAAPLGPELSLMDELAVRFLKTYQVWHHRRLLLARMPQRAAAELLFVARSLGVDAKNYHTWSYRQWVLAQFGIGKVAGRTANDEGEDGMDTDLEEDQEEEKKDMWANELPFVEQMIREDVRNNSAWHHRFFVVWGCGIRAGEDDREGVLRRELAFAKEKICIAPNNASAWNYLRGMLRHMRVPLARVQTFARLYASPRVDPVHASPDASQPLDKNDDTTDEVLDLENPPPSEDAELPCVAAVEFLADAAEQKGGEEGIAEAVELWKKLATELDTIRRKYWEYRIREARMRIATRK